MCVGSCVILTGKPKRFWNPFSSVVTSSGSNPKPPMATLPSILAASSSARYSELGPEIAGDAIHMATQISARAIESARTAVIGHLPWLSFKAFVGEEEAPLGR